MLKFLTAALGFGSLAGMLGAGWFIVHLIQHQTQLENDLKASRTHAATAQAQGTLNTTAAQTVSAVATKTQTIINNTREITHAVETAPGSDAPVDPRSSDAFVGGLCSQPWRTGDPRCGAIDPGGSEPQGAVPAPADPT